MIGLVHKHEDFSSNSQDPHVLVILHDVRAEYLTKATQGTKGCLGSQFRGTQSIMVRKSCWQEREAAGEISSQVRRKRTMVIADDQLPFSRI